ncbi:complex I NDUFA9 subunit family protein [Roseospirillum parvum]|uniref:NADH dehydrogenase n=1 Tax=Roseospirillum parvum TaxID=83401 RepID=A0A1G8AWC9_9PROT|nr:complex I NDUFA9 subunit family protein [Roseospirillum parvum]SDH25312.1 NADH dehydrogenase [Roseospirillum parvum]
MTAPPTAPLEPFSDAPPESPVAQPDSAPLATLFGGSGFIGRHVVEALANQGWRVRVVVRDPEGAKFLKPLGELGQISLLGGSVSDPKAVAAACQGAQAVVNLVGILYQKGRRSFEAMHVEAPRTIAQAARAAGVKRLVHISAMGASPDSEAEYARTKARGEQALLEAFPEATILRPSVVFGPGDGFFNLFGSLGRRLPVLPYFCSDAPGFRDGRLDLKGAGGPRFQPVYVGDVVAAVMKALTEESVGHNPHAGKTYELGGPNVYTMRQVMELVAKEIHRQRLVVPVPIWVARLQASVLQFLPVPPLTPDQVRLLEVDNVMGGDLPGLAEMGITPTAAEAILPTYLHRYRPLHRHTYVRDSA